MDNEGKSNRAAFLLGLAVCNAPIVIGLAAWVVVSAGWWNTFLLAIAGLSLLAQIGWCVRQCGHQDRYMQLMEKRHIGMEKLLEQRTKKLNSINEMLMQMLNKVDMELMAVADFQQSLLPKTEPDFEGFRFAQLYLPSGRASGDYYDFIEINPNQIAIVVADVSGHGTRASVIMAIIRALTQTYGMAYTSPARLLSRLNQMMFRLVPTEDFITMFLGVLNRDTQELIYASAGQPYALMLRRADHSSIHLDRANSIPLKIMEEVEFKETRIQFHVGDRLILYTDGLIEAANPEGELFSVERLQAACRESENLPIRRQIEFISQSVIDFAKLDNLTDDFTLLAIECCDPQASGNISAQACVTESAKNASSQDMDAMEDIEMADLPTL